MKIKFNYLLLLLIVIAAISCKKDNYKAPGSTLSGRLMYKGDSVGVEFNQVPFQIYQPGFGKIAPITGTFAEDGTYSIVTFDGSYKFTIQPNQGPFLWKELSPTARDTIRIDLKGNQTVNIEVTPYYMVRALKTSINASTKVVSANFNIEQVITDPTLAKSIQTVSLFVNKTVQVSNASNEYAVKTDVAGSAVTSLNNIVITATVPALVPTQNYVFARVGIKITGVEDWYYSPVRKIAF